MGGDVQNLFPSCLCNLTCHFVWMGNLVSYIKYRTPIEDELFNSGVFHWR
jgi:hypothetical protein